MYNYPTSQIESSLLLYERAFHEGYPLMQVKDSASPEDIKSEIAQCITQGKKCQELWPEVYGKNDGIFI